uniref:non-specific serine/threonine protein kinase n=1 Tax=Strigamia maritima TaxID=126957 RepID=T1IJZ1_STRMM
MDTTIKCSQSSISKPPEENYEYYIEEQVKFGDKFHNRYIIRCKLGWGNFSNVWMCWDERDQRRVALKITKTAIQINDDALIEIKLLEHIQRCTNDASHKGRIVQLLDKFMISGVNGTHVCSVFEIAGVDLLKLLNRSGNPGIPLNTVKSIMRQVLEALDYLHTTCGIIHTDIKLENICIVENPSCSGRKNDPLIATIADFGSACLVDLHFCPVIQSSPYRSPEVLLGLEYGPSADIWSAACMAFVLATGNFLFPSHCGDRLEAENHLARIVKVLGDFSVESSREIFTLEGKLRGIFEVLTRNCDWDYTDAFQFAEFLLPMLAIDPNKRSSAKDILKHPWLKN